MKNTPVGWDKVLEERTFQSLTIKRAMESCFLIITFNDASHVYVDKKGYRKEYRHAWQIREWFQTRFDISKDMVPVTEINYEN